MILVGGSNCLAGRTAFEADNWNPDVDVFVIEQEDGP
jgi:hypothetical protein